MKDPLRRLAMRLAPPILAGLLCGGTLQAGELPRLGADISATGVSGLSSGAYMAGQFQIAHSRIVTGAGLVAGGPYACAFTPGAELNPFWHVVLSLNLSRAQSRCMEDGWFFSSVPRASVLITQAKRLADADKIDPLAGLPADKVYLFSSSADETVERGVVEGAVFFYRAAGVPRENIRFVKHGRAAHAFLTESEGAACGTSGAPYLNDCDYDQAKAILEWVHGPLQPAAEPKPENFLRFQQAEFADLGEAGLGEEGMAYAPQACRTAAGCAVHIVFHGCKQSLNAVGDRFVKGSGYARWAEANRLVLLFPQATAGALNPNGCWDWWGYTGPQFLERDAPQIRAVRLMLDRLAERP